MGRDMTMKSLNMIGQNGNSQMMGRNMLGQQDMMPNTMYSKVLGQPMGQRDEERDGDILDMTNNRMPSNMMGQDRTSQMMGRRMLGQQDMTPDTMYSNMMGQDMMDMTNNRMLSNMMSSRGMSSDSLINNGLMGQHMMQKMEIERVPETYT